MEEDGNGAEFAAEFHTDPLDQCLAFARRGRLRLFYGAVDLAHFILTAKYLTN